MAKESKLSVTLPDGTVATRRTARSYTHVLAVLNTEGVWVAYNWCGREDLAVKAQHTFLHGKYGQPGRTTAIVAVGGPAVAAPVAAVRTPQQLVEYNRPAYKAYVAAQRVVADLKARPGQLQGGQAMVKALATMDELRPAYRVYRKAAAALRAAKKGVAPAAPTSADVDAQERRADEAAGIRRVPVTAAELAAHGRRNDGPKGQAITGTITPGHGGRDITRAIERSNG